MNLQGKETICYFAQVNKKKAQQMNEGIKKETEAREVIRASGT